MTTKQQIEDKALDQVIMVYKDNKADFESVPALADTMEQVIVKKQSIDDTVAKQLQDTTGTTKSKAETKADLASHACQIAGSISAWAQKTNNAIILEQSNVTVPQLKKLGDKLLPPICRNIQKLAEANLALLIPFGVTSENVQLFATSIDNYVALSAQPRKKILERKNFTGQLVDLFSEAEELLKKQADKLILNLKNTKPDTFKSYNAARVLPSSNGGKDDTPPTPPTV